jgi:putative membrane protein
VAGVKADYASAQWRGQAGMLCEDESQEGRMSMIAKVLVALVAAEHIYILVLEMFLWTTPRTRASFGMSAEQAEQTKVLAANQGLYNGLLAAGLIWALVAPVTYATQLALFFLACVLVAGLYGGATANRRIWFVQALPAAVALAVVLFT